MAAVHFPEKRIEEDPIEPVSVVHNVDEALQGGEPGFRYNYLVYRFVRDGAEMGARCYLDDAGEVSIHGPSVLNDGTGPLVSVEAPALRQAVLRYLTRRFNVITELSGDRGYEPIWIVKRPGWMSRDHPWPPGWRGLADKTPPHAGPAPLPTRLAEE